MQLTNQDRAQQAMKNLLITHRDMILAEGGDFFTVITDTIADLLHLACRQGLNPEQIISLARLHYQAEADETREIKDGEIIVENEQRVRCPKCGIPVTMPKHWSGPLDEAFCNQCYEEIEHEHPH